MYYPLLLLLLKSFNAIAYTFVSILCLRRLLARKAQWGGYGYVCLVMAFAVLFLDVLAQEWAVTTLHRGFASLDLVNGITALLLPPLVVHVFYHSERLHLRGRRVWAALLAIYWPMTMAMAAATLAAYRRGRPNGLQRLSLAFDAYCAFSVIGMLIASRNRLGLLARRPRRWLMLLFLAWICLGALEPRSGGSVVAIGIDTCALAFVFIVTYYTERLTFFDVLVKKAAFVFSSLLLLTLYFAFVTQGIWAMNLRGWIGTLIWALSVWPIVLWAPWGQRQLSLWVDRLWLGRRFSPAAATRYFLAGLQGAISAAELRRLAEQRLGAIFQADVEVLDDAPSRAGMGGAGTAITVPIRPHSEPSGAIRVQPRADSPQFLSEDAALLASLAEVFSFLLENLRLREKRLEHEKREHQLVLNANQSELKALRAQVNPHFLFNALNTIASLIPRQPDRAERTIEQLADLFRYTLRRSDREWVTLDEELEVVCAYLDVEQARFGDRLATRIEASDEARQMRIPAMVVQTLVENAVKHGVGRIRTQGVVEVSARVSTSGLRIAVADNGPGFPSGAARALPPGNGGYGLRNVRERLQGHFGQTASLTVDRDAARGMTVVSLRLPCAAPQLAETRAL
jgi:signal transduction histidine kinase